MKTNFERPDPRGARRGIEILAHMGYAAKAAVYLGIGALTAAAAFGSGSGDASGSRDALRRIGEESWGVVALALVALGIVGYVVWRLVQTFSDPDGFGRTLKGLTIRTTCFTSAIMYGGLGVWVVRGLLDSGLGGGPRGSENGASSWSASLLQQPYGAWLLGLLGVVVIGIGVSEWVRARRASFEKRLRAGLRGRPRRVIRMVARAGLISRGVVFAIIGAFLIHAASTSDPSQARGLEQALETLGQQAYGPWLMGLVALGLAAYGVLQGVKARYRRIGPIQSRSSVDITGVPSPHDHRDRWLYRAGIARRPGR